MHVSFKKLKFGLVMFNQNAVTGYSGKNARLLSGDGYRIYPII